MVIGEKEGLFADDPTIPFHRQSWSDIRLA
jgi:hypothetical protein